MKNIIIAGIVVAIVGILSFFYLEYSEEKEMEEFLNTETKVENSGEVATTTKVSTAEIKTYTLIEIAKHNKKSDCWMSINGNVLDVTSFVDKHPGGDKILEGCGKDATSYFNKVPGHLKGIAQMILKKLSIGKLEE